MSDDGERWWQEYLQKLACAMAGAPKSVSHETPSGVRLVSGLTPVLSYAERTTALEAELQIARELIAELSQRPTLDQWRELMAQAAATVVVPAGDEKGAFPARALAFQRQAVGLLTEKPA